MKAVPGIAGIFIRWNSMDYADSPESLVSTIKEFKGDQAMLSQMKNAGIAVHHRGEKIQRISDASSPITNSEEPN
jgi:hypothetical protein